MLSSTGVAKKGFCLATTLSLEVPSLPFVISTEAQRSGEICGFCGPFPEFFFLAPRLRTPAKPTPLCA